MKSVYRPHGDFSFNKFRKKPLRISYSSNGTKNSNNTEQHQKTIKIHFISIFTHFKIHLNAIQDDFKKAIDFTHPLLINSLNCPLYSMRSTFAEGLAQTTRVTGVRTPENGKLSQKTPA